MAAVGPYSDKARERDLFTAVLFTETFDFMRPPLPRNQAYGWQWPRWSDFEGSSLDGQPTRIIF